MPDHLRIRKWNWLGYTLRSDDSISYKHYNGHYKATEVQGGQKHQEKRSGERNVDNSFQV